MGSAAFHCQCHAQQGKQDRCKKPDSTAPCVPGCNVTLGARKSGTFVFLGDWQGELALPTPKLARTNFAGSSFQPSPCKKCLRLRSLTKSKDYLVNCAPTTPNRVRAHGTLSLTMKAGSKQWRRTCKGLHGWLQKPSFILSSVIDNEKAISNIDNVCGRDGLVQGNDTSNEIAPNPAASEQLLAASSPLGWAGTCMPMVGLLQCHCQPIIVIT